MFGLFDRKNRVTPEIDVDDDVRAAVGDVQEIGAELRRSQRRHLVGRGGPAALFHVLLHRLLDGVAIGVIGRQIGDFLVLAERLYELGSDRLRGGLAVEAFTEGIADAILAGGVVRARNPREIDHLLAVGDLVVGDRLGARDAAGDHDRLVVADELRQVLHGGVRLGFAVGDAEFDLLAEDALLDIGRDFLHQRVAFVQMLDGQLIALDEVLS